MPYNPVNPRAVNPDIAHLGTALGQLGTGNPVARQDAYLKGQMLGAQMQDRMESARKSRADAMLSETQNTALNALHDSYKALGYTDAQADTMANSARANRGANLETAIGSALMAQIPVAGTAAVPQSGEVFQRALGRHTTTVSDGVAYDPLGDATQKLNVTPLGDATIAARNAQASAGNAHARLFDTQAAAGGFRPGSAANGMDDELLTPSAQDLVSSALAHGYAIPLPNFGFSSKGSKAKADALNELASHFKNQGVSMDDAVASMIQGKTAMPGLADTQKTTARIGAWEASAGKQADIALDLSNRVNRTGVPSFNRWLLAGRQGTGDPDVAQLNNATQTLAEEYARVMGGGNAQATDSSRNLAHSMINSAMTQKQFSSVVELMQREMAARKDALHDAVSKQRNGIVAPIRGGGLGDQVSGSAPTTPPNAGGVMHYNPATGRIE